ncbi:MAG: hypothetical protein J6J55_00935, partial [Paludibacteraceae bacterium]|nr:hypothetical protein [Paludibacteraceae bacterium]
MIFRQLGDKVMRLLGYGVWVIGMIGFASCNPDVEAHTKNVDITIQVEEVSAGYARVNFSTNKRAFYLTGIQPVRENIDPMKVAKQFMLLALDSA